MLDHRFYPKTTPLTLEAIAELTEADLPSGADPQQLIFGAAPLHLATGADISFVSEEKYLKDLVSSRAGACFIKAAHANGAPKSMCVLRTADPEKAYALVASRVLTGPPASPVISNQANIAAGARLGNRCVVSAGATIEDDVEIGDDCFVGANSVLASGVRVGANSYVGHNVSLCYCLIGDNVRIHNGSQIGQDGFGYASSSAGHVKIPQVGRVIIQDDVEIGANSTIDRGAADDTVIGAGTKIDNLVQIGHNCRIGRNCILVSQVGLSGSVVLEDHVVLGGKVGVADHVKIGEGAQVAARSGVTNDLSGGFAYGGFPARPIAEWRREVATLRRLAKKPKRKS